MKKLLVTIVALSLLFSLVVSVKADGSYPYTGEVTRQIPLADKVYLFNSIDYMPPIVFSSDKGIIAFIDEDATTRLKELDLSTNTFTELASTNFPWSNMIISPDNTSVYMTVIKQDGTLSLSYFDLVNKKIGWEKQLSSHPFYLYNPSVDVRIVHALGVNRYIGGFPNNNIAFNDGVVISYSYALGFEPDSKLIYFNKQDGSARWEISSTENPQPGSTVFHCNIYPLFASNEQHIYAVEYVEVYDSKKPVEEANQSYERFLDIDTVTGKILKATPFKNYKDILVTGENKEPDTTKPILYDLYYKYDADTKQVNAMLCWVDIDNGVEYPIDTLPLIYGYYKDGDFYYGWVRLKQIGNNIIAFIDNEQQTRAYYFVRAVAYNPKFAWRIDVTQKDPDAKIPPANLGITFKDGNYYYSDKNILSAVEIATGKPILNADLGNDIVGSSVIGFHEGGVYVLVYKNDGKQYIYDVSIKPSTYTIKSTSDNNGSISPTGDVTVNYGDSKTFTITPNTGYHIADVKIDGKSVGKVSTYTFQNITSDHTIEVTFAINTYDITTSTGSNGSISPSGTITVNYGDSKTFTITPNKGYKIRDVKVDGKSVGAVSTYTFANITDNHTIEATFEKNEIVIVLQVGQTTFTVNGTPNTLDSPPIIKNGRTLLPIRPVVEALGGSVSWDGNEKKVTISLGSTTIELWIGKNTARVNGTNTPIDSTNPKVVPEIINGRTMLPLRFVTENLGCQLQWEPDTKTITITYQG